MAVLGLIMVTASCTYFKNEIYIPPVSEPKSALEAEHVSVPPNSLTASYWTTADYLTVNLSDIKKEQISEENGLLNVNGMYHGLSDFNVGDQAELTLKAAYDNENLYILVTWKDKTFNLSSGNWRYNGPKDPLKSDDTTGWTSQRSDDNLVIAFANNDNNKDVWKWSLALSEPMGYAIDMYDLGSGWNVDEGDLMFVRNAAGTDLYRSGPKYEWNGEQQELTRDPGGSTILDPGYFLFNKIEFNANIVNGAARYEQRCSFCHGDNGEGHAFFDTAAVSLTEPGKYNRITDEALNSILSNDSTHAGAFYWKKLSDSDKTDVVARLRAFGGIPGYFLQNPSGSNSDIKALSNVKLAKINYNVQNSGYKVLLIRKLQTGHNDDLQFNLAQSRQYVFDIFLTDDDNLNLIGEVSKQLIFK
jgi:hypothetical protein